MKIIARTAHALVAAVSIDHPPAKQHANDGRRRRGHRKGKDDQCQVDVQLLDEVWSDPGRAVAEENTMRGI